MHYDTPKSTVQHLREIGKMMFLWLVALTGTIVVFLLVAKTAGLLALFLFGSASICEAHCL